MKLKPQYFIILSGFVGLVLIGTGVFYSKAFNQVKIPPADFFIDQVKARWAPPAGQLAHDEYAARKLPAAINDDGLVQSIDANTNINTNVPVKKNTNAANPTPAPAKNTNTNVAQDSDDGSCTGVNLNNWDCYEKHFRKLVQTKGIAAAFDELKQRYPSEGYIRAECHPLTHIIGQEAVALYPKVSDAYKVGDSFCWSGYYHGVLEGYIAKIGRENLAAKINDICSDIPGKDKYTFDYYNCVHGLGHGVMASTADELFDSLSMCDNLKGDWEQKSCASGVFMENVIVDGKNHFTKYLDPKDPLYPCDATPEKYKETCYLMQTSYMLKIAGGDFLKVFDWCASAEANFQTTCYSSLGRDASGRSTSNIDMTRTTCLLGKPGDQQLFCVIGAVKDFVSYYHSDVQAKQFCNSFTDDNLKETCLSTEASYYQLF